MVNGENLKLLGTRHSMFTQRVVWALKLKGIDYEFIEEDLVNKSSLLLAVNPVHKKVPVLTHGGNPIIESKIILEYIDETWKERSLLPQPSQERAYVRFWAALIDDKRTYLSVKPKKIMVDGENLKLLGTRRSMFTQRVVWALKLKGIDYEFIEEDLVNKSSLLLAVNPVHKKVTVLMHGGNPIIESKIILEYIDETWKERSLLPQPPQERAYVRFWAAFIKDKLMEASKKAFASTGDDQVKAIESTVEALQLLEQELHGKKFFGGDEEIGYLDIVAGWIAYWFQFIQEVGKFKAMDSTRFPCLDSWTKNFLQVPIIAQNLPPPDELRNIFGAIRMAMCSK